MDKKLAPSNDHPPPGGTLSRRKALARLGLAAGAVYVAPLLTGLNRAAAGGGGDEGGGPPWGHGSHPCHGHGCGDD